MDPSVIGQVEVFTLSTRTWRSPFCNLPRRSIIFDHSKLSVDIYGCLYWLATDWIDFAGALPRYSYNLIVSFDVTSEDFREVTLPLSLANEYGSRMYMLNLRESLVVLECDLGDNDQVFVVWKTEDGVSKSFTKLFSFNVNTPFASVIGVRKSGEPLVEIAELEYDELDPAHLVFMSPNQNRCIILGLME